MASGFRRYHDAKKHPREVRHCLHLDHSGGTSTVLGESKHSVGYENIHNIFSLQHSSSLMLVSLCFAPGPISKSVSDQRFSLSFGPTLQGPLGSVNKIVGFQQNRFHPVTSPFLFNKSSNLGRGFCIGIIFMKSRKEPGDHTDGGIPLS